MHLWFRDLLRLALPELCCACTGAVASGEALCRSCRARLGPAPAGPAPPGISSCSAAVAFRGEAAAWIHRFKYPHPGLAGLDPAAQGVLHSLAREAAASAAGGELVVPVPLHASRLRSRGFNPAALLARSVARELRVPWDAAAVERVRDTASQTGLGRGPRRRNVAGAFRGMARRVEGVRICLVDDVVTTGSTLAELARELHRCGAMEVQAVCVARTPAGDGSPALTASADPSTS